MKIVKITVLFSAVANLIFSVSVFAAELNGVSSPDQMKVGEKNLVLNGMGLREVRRFGIPVKVYVGSLYLEKKSSDSDAILKSNEVKQLRMEFVRSVDRDSLVEAFRTGYESNCQEACDDKSLFPKLRSGVVNVRKGNQIIFTFYPDRAEMESTGPNAKKVTLDSAALAKNTLALFIHSKNPPTAEFREGVLGLKKK